MNYANRACMHEKAGKPVQKMYAHGGDIHTFAKKLRIAPENVIDFSSNINFLCPSVSFEKVNVAPYPDPEYHNLRLKTAGYLGVDPENLEPYNGASSAIFSLLRHLNPASVTLYGPLYSEYKRTCDALQISISMINRLSRPREPMPGSTVVFVNPSTPDGRLHEMDALIESWKEREVDVIVDESFLDFTEGKSVSSWLENWQGLYIIRSFTKFFSCAGVRTGFVISHPDNIADLHDKEPLWKVSAYDSAYLMQALSDEIFQKRSKLANTQNREKLRHVLEDSSLFEMVYESDANFLLAQLKDMDAMTLQEKLEPFRILIRDCGNFDFLDEFHVRFAVKDDKAIQVLDEALKAIA